MTRANNVHLKVPDTCVVIGAPMANGQPIKGVEWGPSAIRNAGLKNLAEQCEWKLEDRGDLDLVTDESTPVPHVPGEVNNVAELGNACGKIFEAVRSASREGKFVLTLGGDHGIAGGSIAGLLATYPDLVVVWIDAHADCNTPDTSPSGNYHGMPAAHVMGWFKKELPGFEWTKEYSNLPENRLALIGLRDVDQSERKLLRDSKVHCYTMHDIDRDGISQTMAKVLAAIDPEGTKPIHMTFDIDSCDKTIAPGTGTIARGGLSYREAHFIAETMAATNRLVSMDLVEVNPQLDKLSTDLHGDRLVGYEATKTVRLAVDIIGSALGTTILG